MNRKQIMNTIQTLASSQGFYSGLWEYLTELEEVDPTVFAEMMNKLEQEDFADSVDLCIYLEENGLDLL